MTGALAHLHSQGLGFQSSQAKIYSPNDTQAKYTEQSAANLPLRSTGTQGAPCRKQQAGREGMGLGRGRCFISSGCVDGSVKVLIVARAIFQRRSPRRTHACRPPTPVLG